MAECRSGLSLLVMGMESDIGRQTLAETLSATINFNYAAKFSFLQLLTSTACYITSIRLSSSHIGGSPPTAKF